MKPAISTVVTSLLLVAGCQTASKTTPQAAVEGRAARINEFRQSLASARSTCMDQFKSPTLDAIRQKVAFSGQPTLAMLNDSSVANEQEKAAIQAWDEYAGHCADGVSTVYESHGGADFGAMYRQLHTKMQEARATLARDKITFGQYNHLAVEVNDWGRQQYMALAKEHHDAALAAQQEQQQQAIQRERIQAAKSNASLNFAAKMLQPPAYNPPPSAPAQPARIGPTQCDISRNGPNSAYMSCQ